LEETHRTGQDGRTIFKWVLAKWDVVLGTALNCVRTGLILIRLFVTPFKMGLMKKISIL
jgi:hypothetical protein